MKGIVHRGASTTVAAHPTAPAASPRTICDMSHPLTQPQASLATIDLTRAVLATRAELGVRTHRGAASGGATARAKVQPARSRTGIVRAMRDLDVRHALHEAVTRQVKGAPHVLVPEVDIRWTVPARMDALLVSHRIYGFEIKSDVDSLSRLPRQILAYNAAVERAVLVVGDRLLAPATDLVPDWWTIWRARWRDDRVVIHEVRRGRLNPAPNVHAVTMFLLRDDLLAALRQRGHTGLGGLSVDQLRSRLVEDAGPRKTLEIARTAMRSRADWQHRTLIPRAATSVPA